MTRSLPKTKRCQMRRSEPSLETLVEQLVRQLDSPARVLELCYWSRERHVLDIIRAIVALPERTREALEAFLAMAGDPETVAATLDSSGRLSLSSPHVAEALDLMSNTRNLVTAEVVHRTH